MIERVKLIQTVLTLLRRGKLTLSTGKTHLKKSGYHLFCHIVILQTCSVSYTYFEPSFINYHYWAYSQMILRSKKIRKFIQSSAQRTLKNQKINGFNASLFEL